MLNILGSYITTIGFVILLLAISAPTILQTLIFYTFGFPILIVGIILYVKKI